MSWAMPQAAPALAFGQARLRGLVGCAASIRIARDRHDH
jgi:hypothetical protein